MLISLSENNISTTGGSFIQIYVNCKAKYMQKQTSNMWKTYQKFVSVKLYSNNSSVRKYHVFPLNTHKSFLLLLGVANNQALMWIINGWSHWKCCRLQTCYYAFTTAIHINSSQLMAAINFSLRSCYRKTKRNSKVKKWCVDGWGFIVHPAYTAK